MDLSALMKKRIIAWTLFDFASSSYSAVIASVIFPVYYATVIVGNSEGTGDLWWGRAVSLSMFVVALSSPFLGGIADAGGRRKAFLAVYTAGAVIAVALLALLQPGMVMTGFVLAVVANVCVEGGFVFYNAYLPEIAEPGRMGMVSSMGFAVGYAGSILSLAGGLFLIEAGMVWAVWLMAAVIFALFSLPLFVAMKPDSGGMGIWRSSLAGLGQTVNSIGHIIRDRNARMFLLSFFLYTDGVNTVIVFSSLFAVSTLGFGQGEVVILFLMVQACAMAGAMVSARVTDRFGPRRVVLFSIAVWTAVTLAAFFSGTRTDFYFIAAVAGSVLGTIQAASRALFAGFVERGREAEYFGVYSTVGKTSSIVGPLMFGTISERFGSQRPAVLSVALLFIAGLLFLLPVKSPES